MKLTVVEYAGEPVARGVSAVFGPQGGIIGRSNGCSLVLNDAERRISRLQAVLSHDDGGWRLRNASTVVPVMVGDQRLELDQECSLQAGQFLRIGPYLLRSEDDDGMPLQDETSGGARLGNGQLAMAGPAFGPSAGPSRPADANPFAELLGASVLPLASHAEHAVAPGANAGPSPEPPAGQAGEERPWIPPSQFGVLPDDGIPLFGHAPPVRPLAGDGGVTAMPLGGSVDPLALFDTPAHPVTLLDNLGPSLLSVAAPASGPLPLMPTAANAGLARVNVADQVDIGRTVLPITSIQGFQRETVAQAAPADDAASVRTAALQPAAPAPATAAQQAAAAPCVEMPFECDVQGAAADAPRALAHFMTAAGIGHVQPNEMPLDERMGQLGTLLGLFVDGTVRLLSSRALLKREVRAEITQVLDSANNPFKILPSGQAVLMQMFGPRMPGFLSAEDAVRDALHDLQHHQLGMLAGMRAALFELINELNPQRIESEHAPRSLLDRIFPGRVQARRWQQHRSRHQTLQKHLDDEDFYRLFGQTFQRAYEDEIRRCAAAAGRREGSRA